MLAIGAMIDDKLVGLIAWSESETPPIWTSNILAVSEGYGSRGIATTLKTGLIEAGRTSGVRSIHSVVHRDNEDMVNLNKWLGCKIRLDPTDPTKNHLLCELDLQTPQGQ